MQPPMESRHIWARMPPQQGELQIVAVEMDDVEAGYVLEDQFYQTHVMRSRLMAFAVAPQGLRTGLDQPRIRLRVAAGEQRDLMPQPDQFLGQIGDDPLRPPIQLRGDAFVKRGDLRDSHRIFWFFTRICGNPLRSFWK